MHFRLAYPRVLGEVLPFLHYVMHECACFFTSMKAFGVYKRGRFAHKIVSLQIAYAARRRAAQARFAISRDLEKTVE